MSRPDLTRSRQPELVELDAEQRRTVERHARRSARCPACRSRRFDVGAALYVGFLFLSERTDTYFVALVCRRRTCPSPRTGMRITADELGLSTSAERHLRPREARSLDGR